MHPSTGSSVWIDPAVYGHSTSSTRRQPPQSIQQTEERDPRLLSQPKRQPDPITPMSGQKNSAIWEYESPNFQAGSSLPALSLLVSETPTQPQLESHGKVTRRLPRIDEIDTVPPPNGARSIESSTMLVPITSQSDVIPFNGFDSTTVSVPAFTGSNPSSWTAGEASQSSYAQLISSRSKRKIHRPAIALNPLDRARWWLLHPGHIEFLLWLGGTILLVSVTCLLLLVTAFSFEWLTPGSVSPSSANVDVTSTASRQPANVTTTPGLILTRTAPGTTGKGVSTTPVPSSSPAITPTPNAGSSGGKPTPAGPTPVPITPTPPASTPTVTPTVGTTPTVTPTPGTTPTVTATLGTTPTVTPTAGTTPGSIPTASPAASGNSNLGNALDHTGDLPLGKQLMYLSPWVWVMLACYSLSMVLLGLAGVLHKRRL